MKRNFYLFAVLAVAFSMTDCKSPVSPVSQSKSDSVYAVYTGTGTVANARPSMFSPHACYIGDTITIVVKDFKLGSLAPKVYINFPMELPIVSIKKDTIKVIAPAGVHQTTLSCSLTLISSDYAVTFDSSDITIIDGVVEQLAFNLPDNGFFWGFDNGGNVVYSSGGQLYAYQPGEDIPLYCPDSTYIGSAIYSSGSGSDFEFFRNGEGQWYVRAGNENSLFITNNHTANCFYHEYYYDGSGFTIETAPFQKEQLGKIHFALPAYYPTTNSNIAIVFENISTEIVEYSRSGVRTNVTYPVPRSQAGTINSFTFDKSGKYLIALCDLGGVKKLLYWSTSNHTLLTSAPSASLETRGGLISSDGKTILQTAGNTTQIIDAPTGKINGTLPFLAEKYSFSSNNGKLAVITDNGSSLYVIDPQTGTVLNTIRKNLPLQAIQTAIFDNANHLGAAIRTSGRTSIYIWNLN